MTQIGEISLAFDEAHPALQADELMSFRKRKNQENFYSA